jgi:hypothetical protein
MNSLIKVEINKVTKETKGLELFQQTCLKTKTNLEVKFTKKDIGFQELVASDIELLGLEGEKVASFLITIEGASALGRFINRSTIAFSKLGFKVNELDWEATAGVVEIEGDITALDLPYLVEVLLRLVQRATKAISHTHHPLTLFDLKQSIGLIYDLKQETEGAEDLAGWFDVRELTVLEETKEAKAEAKERAKATTKQKAKEKRREKNPKSGPYKGKAKEKNQSTSAKKSATIEEIKSPGLKKGKKPAKLNLA